MYKYMYLALNHISGTITITAVGYMAKRVPCRNRNNLKEKVTVYAKVMSIEARVTASAHNGAGVPSAQIPKKAQVASLGFSPIR